MIFILSTNLYIAKKHAVKHCVKILNKNFKSLFRYYPFKNL